MDAHSLFQIANLMALAGWAMLLLSPWTPHWSQHIAGAVVPLLLSCLYVGLIFAFWSRAEGGFNSLAEVMKLFSVAEIVLAGWVHYLAFDLLIGAWIARTANEDGLAFALIVPCLLLTFMFGPAGYLAFKALQWGKSRAAFTRAS